jgi:hypothetical protein
MNQAGTNLDFEKSKNLDENALLHQNPEAS